MNGFDHTFVICAYKESPFLEECISSLLTGQPDGKVLIATSTPCGHTRRLAEKYSIPLFENSLPGGSIGSDWNFAMSCVTTDYATIVHQDDLYLPGFLEQTKKAFSKPDCLISFTNYGEIKNGQQIKPTINLRIKDAMLFGFLLFKRSRLFRRIVFSFGNPVCCPAVSFNLKLLKDFLFDKKMKASLDWDAWARIGTMKGCFQYIPKRLVLHRIHADSGTSDAIGDGARSAEDFEIFKRYWPSFIAKKLAGLYKNSQKTN